MKKQRCALLGYVTVVNCEEYEVVYESTVNLVEDVADVPDFEVLFAGVPVQSFSVAGKGKITTINPFDDLMSLIAAKRPELIVLENVCGLQLYQKGRTLEYIRNALMSEGYEVSQGKDLQTSRFYVRAVAA